jgi:hypothetical protein
MWCFIDPGMSFLSFDAVFDYYNDVLFEYKDEY